MRNGEIEMADLDKRIGYLKARVAKYETELDCAPTANEKSELRQTINTRNETLNRLLDEKKKSIPQGMQFFLSDSVSQQFLFL
jgi:hypothetical protein